MTKKDLSKYYFLTIEIKDLEERIKELEMTFIGSSKITGMPFCSNKSNPTEQRTELLIKLKNKLENRKNKAMNHLLMIEDYIEKIEEAEIRLIFSKRYIECKKWEIIAKEMHMSERGVYQRHSDYLKGANYV